MILCDLNVLNRIDQITYTITWLVPMICLLFNRIHTLLRLFQASTSLAEMTVVTSWPCPIRNYCRWCFVKIISCFSKFVEFSQNNAMSVVYASRYGAVFLCTHPKKPKMTHASTAKYMRKSKSFVTKWMNRYLEVKNVDDFPDRDSVNKVSQKVENWF